jgi:hypothetical protein
MDAFITIIDLLIEGALLAAAAALGWWLYRMVFWLAIIVFAGVAGRAWLRGLH